MKKLSAVITKIFRPLMVVFPGCRRTRSQSGALAAYGGGDVSLSEVRRKVWREVADERQKAFDRKLNRLAQAR